MIFKTGNLDEVACFLLKYNGLFIKSAIFFALLRLDYFYRT